MSKSHFHVHENIDISTRYRARFLFLSGMDTLLDLENERNVLFVHRFIFISHISFTTNALLKLCLLALSTVVIFKRLNIIIDDVALNK